MSLPQNFCILPWTHLEIQTEGSVKLCCQGPKLRNCENDVPLSVNEQSLESIWNSQDMRMIRAAMLAGVRVPGCKSCWESEDKGAISRRQQVNRDVSSSVIKKIYEYANRDYLYVKKLPVDYQLNMGNTCNLKCRTCSSQYSSKIATDEVAKAWDNKQGIVFFDSDARITQRLQPTSSRFLNGRPWYEDLDFIRNELFLDAKKVSRIQVIGGEPVLLKRFLDVLDHLNNFGLPSTTIIGFTTNGTLTNKKILGVLANFPNTFVTLSFDGIGVQFEYIRHPGKWIDFLSSLEEYRGVKAKLSAIPTFNVYNALNFVDLLWFCEDQGITPILNPLRFPSYLAARVLPPKIRAIVIERLTVYCSKTLVESNRRIAESLIREIDMPNDDFDEKLFRDFIHYTNDLDASRNGDDFKTVFGELFSLIESSGIKWTKELRYASNIITLPKINS